MRKQKILTTAGIFLLCPWLMACSTTAGENTVLFVNEVQEAMGILLGSSGSSDESPDDNEDTKVALDTPANFSVDEDGNFAFDTVENASYYILYFCDPEEDEDSSAYLFSSTPIEDEGDETISGNCFEIFDYSYAEFTAKVVAFPELADDTYKMSDAAVTDYVFAGEQSAPEIAYMWDIFSQTLDLQISNVGDYYYQAYPEQVEIIFTNTEDSSDVLTLTIDSVSADNYSISTVELPQNVTYSVSASAITTYEFVTNQVTDPVPLFEITLGEDNQASDDYSYQDGIKAYFSWPIIVEAFNLTDGGDVGNYVCGYGTVEFIADPVSAESGTSYSYELTINPASFMANVVGVMTGTLDLYTDGTFRMTEPGSGPLSGGYIDGTWKINEDGTATLNFDHSSYSFG